MTKRWVRMPAPGEFRGEGEWIEVNPEYISERDYEYIKETGYLPWHEGEFPPMDAPKEKKNE